MENHHLHRKFNELQRFKLDKRALCKDILSERFSLIIIRMTTNELDLGLSHRLISTQSQLKTKLSSKFIQFDIHSIENLICQ